MVAVVRLLILLLLLLELLGRGLQWLMMFVMAAWGSGCDVCSAMVIMHDKLQPVCLARVREIDACLGLSWVVVHTRKGGCVCVYCVGECGRC